MSMLCEKCTKQEASVQITENWAGSEVSKTMNVCADCARSVHGLEGIPNLETVLDGSPCRYCGGKPCSGGLDPLASLSGVRTISMMCKSCADEYFRFVRQKWPGFGGLDITDEQIANIRGADTVAVFRQAEEYMRKWVAERNSE
jgi:protein-arginine kinase activator protein McsA